MSARTKDETIADIVKKMRNGEALVYGYAELADRIEAAHKREMKEYDWQMEQRDRSWFKIYNNVLSELYKRQANKEKVNLNELFQMPSSKKKF